MKIIDLYKDLLSAGSLIADADGMVSASIGGATTPFTVEGKRLVLPSKQHLSNADWSNRVVFHPLSENVLRGESKVMEKFRSAINLRMNYVLGQVAQELLQVVTSVATHKLLSPDQSEILSKVKTADEKTMVVFQSLLKAMGMGNKDKCIVHIFLKRGGIIHGKKYNRAAIVDFPLYKELQKDEKQIYGVTVSTKHKAAISNLLEFILPGIGKAHSFDRGSESDIAPFLDCLMQSVMAIASCINAVVDDYDGFIDKPETLIYSDGWVETFENLAQLLPEIRSIPMQAGNEGATAKAAAVTAPATQQLQNVQPAHPHAPIPMPAVIPPPVMAQPYMAQPCYQPPVPQAAGPVKTESGGIDFAASMRGNPQLAAQLSYNPYGAYPGVAQQIPPGPIASRMGSPRWDQPAQGQMGWPQQQYGQPQPQYGQQYFQQPQGGYRGI